MQSLGHPVVGDTLYGAPRSLAVTVRSDQKERPMEESAGLERNFLHAAHLEFAHPQTSKVLTINAPLPAELDEFLGWLRTERVPVG
jgi:23S rRNA pseudouridine1911/1915/1917 synthase